MEKHSSSPQLLLITSHPAADGAPLEETVLKVLSNASWGGGNRSARLVGGGVFTTSNIWAKKKNHMVVRCYSATFGRGVEPKSCRSSKSNHDATINCSWVIHPKTGAETFSSPDKPEGCWFKIMGRLMGWGSLWSCSRGAENICPLLLAGVCSPVCKEWVQHRGQIHSLMWVQPVLFLSSRWNQTPAQDCLSWPFQIYLTILPF